VGVSAGPAETPAEIGLFAIFPVDAPYAHSYDVVDAEPEFRLGPHSAELHDSRMYQTMFNLADHDRDRVWHVADQHINPAFAYQTFEDLIHGASLGDSFLSQYPLS